MSLKPGHSESGTPFKYVKIYCLVSLTKAQEELYVREIKKSDLEMLDWVYPQFVPWTGDRDGTLDDLFKIWKEERDSIYSFFFFIDRQCLSNTSVIIAQVDTYTIVNSDEALKLFNDYLARYPIPGLDEIHEGHMEEFMEEACNRGLTYGRVPAWGLRSIWVNLDVTNMDMCECVEYHGEGQEGHVNGLGVVEMIPNPEWNPEAFMQKLREAMTPRYLLRSGNHRSLL